MIISKYTDKNGNENVSLVIHKNFLKDCKNTDYVRLTLSKDFLIGLDEKKQVKLGTIINFNKLVDNTKE